MNEVAVVKCVDGAKKYILDYGKLNKALQKNPDEWFGSNGGTITITLPLPDAPGTCWTLDEAYRHNHQKIGVDKALIRDRNRIAKTIEMYGPHYTQRGRQKLEMTLTETEKAIAKNALLDKLAPGAANERDSKILGLHERIDELTEGLADEDRLLQDQREMLQEMKECANSFTSDFDMQAPKEVLDLIKKYDTIFASLDNRFGTRKKFANARSDHTNLHGIVDREAWSHGWSTKQYEDALRDKGDREVLEEIQTFGGVAGFADYFGSTARFYEAANGMIQRLRCPATFEFMDSPVRLACGHCCDRKAFEHPDLKACALCKKQLVEAEVTDSDLADLARCFREMLPRDVAESPAKKAPSTGNQNRSPNPDRSPLIGLEG